MLSPRTRSYSNVRIPDSVLRHFCLPVPSNASNNSRKAYCAFLSSWLLLSLLLVGAKSGYSQTPNSPGIEPFSTQTGGAYDSINLSSSNIMFTLPIRSKNGPVPFSFALRENSPLSISQSLSETNVQHWSLQNVPSGNLIGLGPMGLTIGAPLSDVSVTATLSVKCPTSGNFVPGSFVVTDSTAAPHPLNAPAANPCNGAPVEGFSQRQMDPAIPLSSPALERLPLFMTNLAIALLRHRKAQQVLSRLQTGLLLVLRLHQYRMGV